MIIKIKKRVVEESTFSYTAGAAAARAALIADHNWSISDGGQE